MAVRFILFTVLVYSLSLASCQLLAEERPVFVDLLMANPQLNLPPYNWNKTSDDPCTWYQVSCSNNHVSSLQLSSVLNGTIPPSIGDLSQLTALSLGGNPLTGTIPSSIGNLNKLLYLYINGGQLIGSIPSSFSNLTELITLYIYSNQLTGTIPIWIGNLRQLTRLSLGFQLNGSIPSSIGNLKQLLTLSLSNNELTGSIPPSIANLTNLQELQLGKNYLTGTIPSSIANFPRLTWLDLSYNQLGGCLSLQRLPTINYFTNNSICCEDTRYPSADLGWQMCPNPSSLHVVNNSQVTVGSNYYNQLVVDEGGVLILNQSISIGCMAIYGSITIDLSAITVSETLNNYGILKYQCTQQEVENIQLQIINSQSCTSAYTIGSTSPLQGLNTVWADITISCSTPTMPQLAPQNNYSPESAPQPNNSQLAEIVVPSVLVPLAVAAVIIGVILWLRKKHKRKNIKQMNPIPLEPPTGDKRLIPYNTVTLEKEIGTGSYGKGKWRSTKVAVKIGNGSISTEEFLKEAEFQMNIPPHPNIVQLLGISTDGPQPLVILEYCNEGSLDTHLFDIDQNISTAKQLHLANSIAKGLYHLHENNIVHRDLAVRNVLLNNGVAKISDFGMSRILKETTNAGKTSSNIGPIRWMAPESITSQTYSIKTDIWMFGIILYEITARQEPHIGEDILSIAIKIRDSGLTPTIVNDCPLILKEIMEMCWQMDPSMRPTMEQNCQKLEEYFEE